MLELTFSSKLYCGPNMISIAKTASRNKWRRDLFYQLSIS